MKPFPVLTLNPKISEAMSKIASIDIHQGIEDGLTPQIYLTDEKGGSIEDIAKITPVYTDPKYKCQVTISAAYMQIFWIICDTALKINDSIAINIEIEKMSQKKKVQFFNELKKNTPETNYLKSILDKKKVFQQSAEKIDLIEKINSKNLTEEEMEQVYELDMTSYTGVRTNSMYVYGMAFCLLHEFSHHALGHDIKTGGTIEDEVAADQEAFWSIYSDLTGDSKETAMYGCICSLVSLMFINTKLLKDNEHPSPVERIFTYYELIKDDNPKYAGLLCILFYIWAILTNDKNMPKWDRPYNEMVYVIKDHLLEIENKNNCKKTND